MEIFEPIIDLLLYKVRGIFTLQEIIDTIPVGICIATPDGNIVMENNTFAQMFGYKKEEMVGKYFLNITAYEDIERSTLALKEFLEKGLDSYSIRKKYIRKDSTEFEAIATVHAIKRHGKTTYGIVVIKNLDEEVKIEKKIKFLEEKFNIVFNNTDTPMAIVWLDGLIYEINEKFLSLLDKPKEQVLYQSFFNFFGNSKVLQETFLNYIRSGNKNLEISVNIRTSSNSEVVNISMSKFNDVVLLKLTPKGKIKDLKTLFESSFLIIADALEKDYKKKNTNPRSPSSVEDLWNYYVKYISLIFPFDIILSIDNEFIIKGIKLSESIFRMYFDKSIGDRSYRELSIFKPHILDSNFTLNETEEKLFNKSIYEIFNSDFANKIKKFLLSI